MTVKLPPKIRGHRGTAKFRPPKFGGIATALMKFVLMATVDSVEFTGLFLDGIQRAKGVGASPPPQKFCYTHFGLKMTRKTSSTALYCPMIQ